MEPVRHPCETGEPALPICRHFDPRVFLEQRGELAPTSPPARDEQLREENHNRSRNFVEPTASQPIRSLPGSGLRLVRRHQESLERFVERAIQLAAKCIIVEQIEANEGAQSQQPLQQVAKDVAVGYRMVAHRVGVSEPDLGQLL